MMKPLIALALLAMVATPACAQQTQSGGQGQPAAEARFTGRDGKNLGAATLIESPQGVLIQLRLTGIPAGNHGFHFHQAGRCDPPDFQSAGGHFNPTSAKHGFLNAQGAHAGDMPNLIADSNGTLNADILATEVSLGSGPNSLFHEGGTALVVHAGPDDYATDPAGKSGDRIACGVIARQGRQ